MLNFLVTFAFSTLRTFNIQLKTLFAYLIFELTDNAFTKRVNTRIFALEHK